MKTYKSRQWGICEVVAEYADVRIIKTPKGAFWKLSPTGIVPVTKEFVDMVNNPY